MSDLVSDNFLHIRKLAKDIETKFDANSTSDQRIRNEIAGMFAVTIAASYEGIVKETLVSYAGKFHPKYKSHVEKDFDRLNARIGIDDLKLYSRRFGLAPWQGHRVKKNSTTFHKHLLHTKTVVERRFRADLLVSYENIFTWRHAYAHERSTSATFNDVYNAHRVAQYVIRCFVKAFEEG